jgi:CelD/BcsL family acetyltransferase involved in cellulose biosynthesis
MKFETISIRDLSSDLLVRWEEILRQSPELDSPYFRPQFSQAVAAVRENVEIAILREGGAVVGFFPFERVSGSTARPVGSRLSDYQAVITPRETQWQASELMRACGLKAWEFDHQLASQEQLQLHFANVRPSRRIDCSAGYDAYLAARKEAGAGALSEMLRKSRKLAREHAVRFEWHCTNESVLNQLLAWKSEQYRRCGLSDVFAQSWTVALLRSIWARHEPAPSTGQKPAPPKFAGVLSVLYADERPAAIHFGMQSGALLHSWFPAYDAALGKYSPGSGLLLAIVEQAGQHGVQCVDLGKGDEDYKQTLATGGVPVAEGAVETRRVAAAIRRGWRQTCDWVRQSPLHKPARIPIRWLKRMRDWVAPQ